MLTSAGWWCCLGCLSLGCLGRGGGVGLMHIPCPSQGTVDEAVDAGTSSLHVMQVCVLVDAIYADINGSTYQSRGGGLEDIFEHAV